MRRPLFSFILLGALAAVAVAQPAPPATAQPGEPPAPLPSPDQPEPPAAVVAEPKLEPKPEPAEPPKPPEVPPSKKLQVGTEGLFQPGMLAQAWILADVVDGNTALSTLRLRRAEMSVKGEILPKRVGYQIMFDPAKVREPAKVVVAGPPDAMGNPTTVTVNSPTTAISALQDFYITFLSKNADVSIGQFKIPVSWEGLNSSAKILMPERALVSTLYGDKRDLGIRIAKQFDKFGYHAGIYNGQGLNNLDTNNQKDGALRLEVYPVKGMTIAGVAYDSLGYRTRAGTKDRWEGDFRYETGPFLVQAEFIEARDVKKDKADATKERGFYAAVAYTIKNPSLHGDLQPVVRFGYVDNDTTKDLDPVADKDDELWHYELGANYYLKGHEMKLQGSFQRQQFQTKVPVNELILAAQVWY